jgi:Protein of unknown function (DUF2795)
MRSPASKQELLAHASQQSADANARAAVEHLPDEAFETPADVSKALGEQE